MSKFRGSVQWWGSCHEVTDDQQDVGSACERQDGKRVVKGCNAKHCSSVAIKIFLLFTDSIIVKTLMIVLQIASQITII